MGFAEAEYTINEALSQLKKSPVAGLVPNSLQNLVVVAGNGQAQITFTPSDTIIEGKLVCTMGGVIIRRKIGSAPIDETDGDLVANISGDNLYNYTTTPFVDSGLTNNTTYFYRFFTYSIHGVINRDLNSIKMIVAGKAAVWGFHQDFTNLDPDSSITYIEDAVGYTPMMTNTGRGTATEGSWANWIWLQKNLPYMVTKDGAADYQLNPMDYTKKLDGSGSDYKNASYEGGAFAWLPKLYMKEVYASNGNSRDVYFALENTSSNTSDFHIAPGFRDKLNNEIDGIWLPIFYAGTATVNQSVAGWLPITNRSVDEQLAVLDTFSSRAALLGGPLMNTLRDLFYMLYKSTNIQEKGGYGNCNNTEILYNYSVNTSKSTPSGRFFGSAIGGKALNNALHSSVLFSYNVLLADPYTVRATDLYLKFNTTYDANGLLTSSGKQYNSTTKSYSSKLAYGGDLIGSVILQENTASSSTGLCDTVSAISSSSVRIGARLGSNQNAEAAGPGMIECTYSSFTAAANLGFATIILPPAGYTPAL